MLLTIQEVARIVGDDEDNIKEFIREDRIPWVAGESGVLIPFASFQVCMPDLYDLEDIW